MPGFLKQSTASQTRLVGPFVDDTDFKTAETALTIANTDVKLSANGAASANKNSGGGTHSVNGMYALTFDATDTATVGQLAVSISVAGALMVTDYFTVLEEAIYDALFAASANAYAGSAGATTLGSSAVTEIANAAYALFNPGSRVGIIANRSLQPFTFEQITSLSSATGLDTTKAINAKAVRIYAEGQNVRVRADGTDPTTSVGEVIAAGSYQEYAGGLTAIKIIEVTSGAKVDVHYFR